MAYNDMHVIIFKILAYVYDCMKRDEKVEPALIDAAGLGVPEAYWLQVLREILRHGYVTGVLVRDTKDGTVVSWQNPQVTLEGAQYLMENSMMRKAARFVAENGGPLATIAAGIITII